MEHNSSISLGGDDWRLGYKKIYDGSGSGTIAEIKGMTEWVKAVVPGNVRADLMAAGRLPDLFVGMNNNRADWVDDCLWWYEKRFKRPEGDFKRFFLELKGIDYISQVFFNGRKMGENEGMFTRHLYDVSSQMKDENLLHVRIVGSSFLPKPPLSQTQKLWEKIGAPLQGAGDNEVFPERTATLKCQMSFGWDFAPKMRTMGIWDDVNIIGSGSVFIGRIDIRPSVYSELESVKLQIRLFLNSSVAAPVKIMIRLSPANFDGPSHSFNFNAFLKRGIEIIERNVVLKKPRFWNPWDQGEPNLYDLNVTLLEKDKQTDSMSGVIGFRNIEMSRNPNTPKENADLTFMVNGKRQYIRGANWVPADSLMGRLREEDYEELIMMAKEANVNMFRVWGGGLREKKAFYDICSREGILVWQEFPFACVFLGKLPTNEAFLRVAEKEVNSIVKSLANHTCVALYCGGNEFSPKRNAKLLTRVARAVRGVDQSRPLLPVSPAKGDSHNWFIWHGFANIREYQNDKSQFASEFGIQAVPSVDSMKKFLTKRGFWPPGEEWVFHKAELEKLERYVGPPGDFSGIEEYVEMSQKMQSFALQTAIEHFRRRKPECSGTIFWQLNDPWPAISWSVIDYYRNPKLAYHKLKESYSPILISFKYEFKSRRAGELVQIEAWIVNDTNETFENCKLDVYMENDGERIMNLSFDVGTIPADSSKAYFRFSFKLRAQPDWPLRATLRCGDEILSNNSYDFTVHDAGEATKWNRVYDRMTKLVLS